MTDLESYVTLIKSRWDTFTGKAWRTVIISYLSRDRVWKGNPDLRGIDLSKMDLRNCDLSSIVLDFAYLDKSDFTEAFFQRTSLIGASLRHSNLTRADLGWSDLRGCDLSGAVLDLTDFDQAHLGGFMADTSIPLVDPNADVRGYHITNIPKGVYGKSSKIREELEELEDAEKQGIKIMVLTELSDLYGALEACAQQHGVSMEDLRQMSDVTKRAFESGHRK